ncbi:MAG: TIGR01777 family oxidoreductase [Pyrinomonadaceae bacterium]
MKILVTGAGGFVGSRLTPALKSVGHNVLKLSRSNLENSYDVQWNPKTGIAADELKKLEGIGAVIHLAGESVADGNWSDEKKARIRESRVEGTRALVDSLNSLIKKPKIFIGASAIGYYGNRGEEILTEESAKGEGFLAEVAADWESEIQRASIFAERVNTVRIGIVLSKEGGALGAMLTPFSYGVGGVLGSGKQYMSWVALEDLVRAFVFLINNDEINGVVNAVSPNPVTNQEFTAALGKVLNRPTVIPIPEFGIKFIFGEKGQKLLLDGARVLPKALEDAGFEFEYPKIIEALEKALK